MKAEAIPAKGLRHSSSGENHFQRDRLRPAFLVTLRHQFLHYVQSPARVACQFAPAALSRRRFRISPDDLQCSHSGSKRNRHFSKMDLPVCFRMEDSPKRANRLSLSSHGVVIWITRRPAGCGRPPGDPRGRCQSCTALSVMSRPRSIIAKASRNCCSLMQRGGLV